MGQEIEDQASAKMHGAVEALDHEFATLRTGRASATLLDTVEVDAYGTPMAVKQVASISVPDGRSLVIQPWDKNMIGPIEKAILKANLGFTPNNDGKVVRINIPALTEERRKELVKLAHKMAENARVAVRNVRRHSNDELKKAEKDHKISEDELAERTESVQKLTDKTIGEIDKHLAAKEKDILTV